MIVKSIYNDKSILLKKQKNNFILLEEKDNLKYKTVKVLSPKEAIVLKKDIELSIPSCHTYELKNYKIISKQPIDFEKEDIWVFALIRALNLFGYDDIKVVFEDYKAFVLAYVKDKTLMYYEVFFDKDSLLKSLKDNEDILIDTENIDYPNTLNIPYIKKGQLIAFGGALKYLNKDSSEDIISYKKLKRELINLSYLIITILVCYTVVSFSIKVEKNQIKSALENTFEKAFPNIPIVDIREQVLAFITPSSKMFELSKLILKAYKNLPSDAKVYSLNYNNGVLDIKSEVNNKELPSLKNIVFSRNIGSKTEIIQQWKK